MDLNTIELNIRVLWRRGGGEITMYFAIYKLRMFPQLFKIGIALINKQKQKHLNLILTSVSVMGFVQSLFQSNEIFAKYCDK